MFVLAGVAVVEEISLSLNEMEHQYISNGGLSVPLLPHIMRMCPFTALPGTDVAYLIIFFHFPREVRTSFY